MRSPARSVEFRAEIGRTPRRNRSTSGSRSVHFRLEIGPLPARDRSHSASRSVHFRLEIGRVPRRVQDAHRRRLEVQPRGLRARKEPSTTKHRQCVPPSSRSFRGRESEDRNTRRSERTVLTASRRQREEHISLIPRIGRLKRGCTWEEEAPRKRQLFFAYIQGLARCVSTSHHIPMCTEGVCAHGSRSNSTHQNLFSRDSKVSIGADRGRMCNIVNIVNSTPEAAGRLQPHRKGRLQNRPCTPTDGRSSTSAFRSADRASQDASKSRSSENPRRKRRAPRPEPISTRVATDLGAEVDRSRGGVRPISAS